MPYTSYKGISRSDSDAIYSYLMSRPAVDVAPPENSLPFPLNQRMAMIGWNLLFFNDTPLPNSSQGSSPEWVRGKYLVNVLEHCAGVPYPKGRLR
ncbi:Gluconate 2-dehydrogenase cytochrome c subunit precursor [Providencia alcalifaciens]|nr:Gluconate 2-dehydrogenase cytochrome c subunit precursor [Providencia alcalifaciens]